MRLLFDAIMLFSIVFGFWYIAIPIGLIGIWVFPFYFESMLGAFMHDALFGFKPEFGFAGYSYVIGAALALLLAAFLKIVIKR